MNENPPSLPDHCPGCQEKVEPKWFVCPRCGLRLKPANDLLKRSLGWIAVLTVFVSTEVVVAKNDQATAWVLAIFVGVPLVFAFSQAALFRIRGQPLTWNQIGRASIAMGAYTIGLLVILPLIVIASGLILLFLICAGSGAFR